MSLFNYFSFSRQRGRDMKATCVFVCVRARVSVCVLCVRGAIKVDKAGKHHISE